MKSREVAPVFYLIHEVGRAFRRQLEERTREYDLTLPQWRILTKLGQEQGLSQVALAQALDTDPMTLSGIVGRLSERNLVRREPDPDDGRAKIVHLTDEGRALFASVEALGVEIYKSAIGGMEPTQLQTLIDGLSQVRDNLNGPEADQKDLSQ